MRTIHNPAALGEYRYNFNAHVRNLEGAQDHSLSREDYCEYRDESYARRLARHEARKRGILPPVRRRRRSI